MTNQPSPKSPDPARSLEISRIKNGYLAEYEARDGSTQIAYHPDLEHLKCWLFLLWEDPVGDPCPVTDALSPWKAGDSLMKYCSLRAGHETPHAFPEASTRLEGHTYGTFIHPGPARHCTTAECREAYRRTIAAGPIPKVTHTLGDDIHDGPRGSCYDRRCTTPRRADGRDQ